ncbi:Hypothetical protein PHPALM_3115 [Phytophthora palmivora]|uniref:Uncharacterized protein n=1 Tax=Phytophthora palmivora TaxID=4796 RepID=A0A2P4YNB4_9STRA|nr:Hypothetical protein PHPALM_3115 [Phytophthora palmivora]
MLEQAQRWFSTHATDDALCTESSNRLTTAKRPVPNAVAQTAPRQNGKQLCLRFISAKGYPSTSPDRCTHHFLGQFTPEVLDPSVRPYIIEKYGGLSADVSDHLGRARLEELIRLDEMAVAAHSQQSFKTVGVHCPSSPTVTLTATTKTTFIFNSFLQHGLSAVIRRLKPSLPDTVRLWRGQTTKDSQPIKASSNQSSLVTPERL